MSDDDAMAMALNLGEAGGITGVVALCLYIVVRYLKREQCNSRLTNNGCNNCNGEETTVVEPCADRAESARDTAV